MRLRTEWRAVTKGTKWCETSYTLTCQKAEQVTPVVSGKFIAFVPAGNTSIAINLTTGETVGAIYAGDGIEIKGAYLYVASMENGNITAIKELGAAVANKKTTMGGTNVLPSGGIMKYNSYLMRVNGAAMATYSYNGFMDEAAMNTAMGDLNIGRFGTLTFTNISNNKFAVSDETGEEFNITDRKVNFVYATYDGSAIKPATGNAWSPLAFNQIALRMYACDMALGYRAGTSMALWQGAMRTYGGVSIVQRIGDRFDGATIQDYNINVLKATSIPSQYNTALANYVKYTTEAGKTEAQIKADLEAANAALAAAQKAFDDALAANSYVISLKNNMLAAEAAYTATRQPEYEARLAYETAKAAKAENEIELKAILDEKTAAMNDAKAKYDAAKAEYDAAVEADANLKALNAELVVNTTARNNITNNTPEKNVTDELYVSKATLQAAAQARQTGVDNYKKWASLYERFMEAYEELANVALWTEKMAEECDFSESPLYKAFKDIPAQIDGKENVSYPTFTYYYDEATETYTIFVTSATQKNTVPEFSSTYTGGGAVTGQNWLISPVIPE